LKCQPTRPLNQMTTSVQVDQRRWRAAAIAITPAHSRGRMAGGSGSLTAAKPTGFSPNCFSTLSHVGIWKSGAPATNGRAKLQVRCSEERSWQDDLERKRRRADSLHGSRDRSQSDSEDGSGSLSAGSRNAFSPAAIVTASRFSSGGIGQLHPVPYAQKGL
jgi:hypothetical protein